jgi:hypothetical protein
LGGVTPTIEKEYISVRTRNDNHDDENEGGRGGGGRGASYPIAPARPRRLVSMCDAMETVR